MENKRQSLLDDDGNQISLSRKSEKPEKLRTEPIAEVVVQTARQKSDKNLSLIKDRTTADHKSNQVISRIVKEDIRAEYKFGKVLGSGNFGTVRSANKKRNPEKHYAVKSMQREILEKDIGLLAQELNILLSVDHPNIVKFYEVYYDDRYVHIVEEWCKGGELYQYLEKVNTFDEELAKNIIRQILLALNHLHEFNVAHRDLKPENILFESGHQCKIKLIDFGMSKLLDAPHNQMFTTLGTPYYVSPEVLAGKYDKRCDLWSVGVITYILLCGEPPFQGNSTAAVFHKIKTCDFDYNENLWKDVSPQAVKFVDKLLEPNLNKRMSAQEALKHPWLAEKDDKNIDVKGNQINYNEIMVDSLVKITSPTRLQHELIMMLVGQINVEEFQDQMKIFQAIDIDYSGSISVDEIQKAIEQSESYNQLNKTCPQNSKQNNEENIKEKHDQQFEFARQLIQKVDYDNNEEISYTEYLASTLKKNHLIEENFMNLFKFLDVYHLNYLTSESLAISFKRAGKDLTQESVDQMFIDQGLKTQTNIDFQLFRNIIQGVKK